MKFKGKHSEVYVEGDRAIKVFKPQFRYNFWKEVRYLNILQRRGFVPKVYSFDPNNLTIEMEFVNGLTIRDFVKEREFDEIVNVLKKSLDICFYLDRMRIQKEEMNHPHKHIIIADRVVFIDFERAYENPNPSNVTQFLEYIRKVTGLSVDKELIKRYKDYFRIRDYNILKATLFSACKS
jgi:putative serine/threonine protein kinase